MIDMASNCVSMSVNKPRRPRAFFRTLFFLRVGASPARNSLQGSHAWNHAHSANAEDCESPPSACAPSVGACHQLQERSHSQAPCIRRVYGLLTARIQLWSETSISRACYPHYLVNRLGNRVNSGTSPELSGASGEAVCAGPPLNYARWRRFDWRVLSSAVSALTPSSVAAPKSDT